MDFGSSMNDSVYETSNSKMNEMQGSQSYLNNFDDPSTFLTYFIGPDEGCSSLTSPLSSGALLDHNRSNMHISQPHLTNNDHPYSRLDRESVATLNSVPYVHNEMRTIDQRLNNDNHLTSHLASNIHNYVHLSMGNNTPTHIPYDHHLLCSRNRQECSSKIQRNLFDTNNGSPITNHTEITNIPDAQMSSLPNSSSKSDHVVYHSSIGKNISHDYSSQKTPSNRSETNSIVNKDSKETVDSPNTNLVKKDDEIKDISFDSKTKCARLRTVIILKIVEQTIYKGKIVKKTIIKDDEVVRDCGMVPWPYDTEVDENSTEVKVNDSLISTSPSSEITESPSYQISSNDEVSCESATKKVDSNISKGTSSKESSKRKSNASRSSKKSKDGGTDSEEARRETANTLLSLQNNERIDEKLDSAEPVFMPISEGLRILAKWTDKNFYPGTITSCQTDGKWLVSFDDGGKRIIHESEIISTPYLSVGQPVMVFYLDEYCAKGIIKAHRNEDEKLIYDIEHEDANGKKSMKQYFAKDVFLTAELAAVLMSKQNKSPLNVSKFADVDLKNIIPKRSRTKVINLENQEAVGESEFKSSKKKFSKIAKSDGSSNGNEAIKSKKVSHKHGSSLLLATDSENLSKSNKNYPSGEKEKLLGPLPPEGSTLFKGIGFMLTTAEDVDSEEMVQTQAGRSIPFDVPYLVKQMVMGGGKVYDNLEDVRATGLKDIILIAYTYLKTVRYLQCLAAGIPCIMHTWIIECCRKNQLLKRDSYLLPSGYSIINCNLPSDKNIYKKSANVFKGMKFMIASDDPRLTQIWTPVLTAANATIVNSLPACQSTSKKSNMIDVIIADSSCPQSVINKAEQLKIPIVSSEYIVQCLISGRRLAFDAHQKFNYNIK